MFNSNLFQLLGNRIKFNNGTVIEFEYPINVSKTIIIDFVVIIILKIPSKAIYNNNVFAITTTGNLLWQIDPEEPHFQNKDCPFVDIRLTEDDKIKLFNWCSLSFVVDPITGKILDKGISQ